MRRNLLRFMDRPVASINRITAVELPPEPAGDRSPSSTTQFESLTGWALGNNTSR